MLCGKNFFIVIWQVILSDDNHSITVSEDVAPISKVSDVTVQY